MSHKSFSKARPKKKQPQAPGPPPPAAKRPKITEWTYERAKYPTIHEAVVHLLQERNILPNVSQEREGRRVSNISETLYSIDTFEIYLQRQQGKFASALKTLEHPPIKILEYERDPRKKKKETLESDYKTLLANKWYTPYKIYEYTLKPKDHAFTIKDDPEKLDESKRHFFVLKSVFFRLNSSSVENHVLSVADSEMAYIANMDTIIPLKDNSDELLLNVISPKKKYICTGKPKDLIEIRDNITVTNKTELLDKIFTIKASDDKLLVFLDSQRRIVGYPMTVQSDKTFFTCDNNTLSWAFLLELSK